jgi:ATP-binding protein involved in chromosome partitioning
MVENMSYFICPSCNQRYDIFGSGGAKKRAAELDIPFLGEVPINISIRVHGDEGQTMRNFDEPDSAPFFEAICFRLVKNLADQAGRRPPMPSLPVL